MRTLIVLPLQAEIDHLSGALQANGLRLERTAAGRLDVVSLPEIGAVLARGGHGKAQFALHTRHLLDHAGHVDLVICAVAAGALVEGIAVGDVVVGLRTVQHDVQSPFSGPPAPFFAADAAAIQSLRELAPGEAGFALHLGDVASGDEDIVSVDRAQALRLAPGALAVAWEGAGGARACAFSATPYLELRALTDQANVEASSHFAQHLPLAMRNLATLLGRWLGR